MVWRDGMWPLGIFLTLLSSEEELFNPVWLHEHKSLTFPFASQDMSGIDLFQHNWLLILLNFITEAEDKN